MKKLSSKIKNTTVGFLAICAATFGTCASADGLYAGAGGGLFGWKVFAGYEVFDKLAFEVARISMDDIISPIFSGEDREYVGTQGSVVGFLPLWGQSSVFGRVGAFSWRAEEAARKLESGTDLSYGIGYQYKFGATQNWAVRAELERFNNIGGLLSASLVFKF